jgi:hypothetical protein
VYGPLCLTQTIVAGLKGCHELVIKRAVWAGQQFIWNKSNIGCDLIEKVTEVLLFSIDQIFLGYFKL